MSTQTAELSAASLSENNGYGIADDKLDELILAVKKGLVFDYMKFEEFKAKIDNARNSQSV
ncbi:hypothetical protein D3C86_1518570 [compost metagenome]